MRSGPLEVGGVLIFVSGVAAALGRPRRAAPGRAVPRAEADRGAPRGLVALGRGAGRGGLGLALRRPAVPASALDRPGVSPRRVAGRPARGGSAIGVINAARIGAGFIGPVAATTLLAWTSPAVVYLLLASIGLACVPLVRMREAGARA